MALENLKKERLKKLNNLKRLGINPYPSKIDSGQARMTIERALKMIGKKVVVAGRLRSLRPHGKITFADLEDATEKIQLLFRENGIAGGKYDFLPNLDLGDFVGVMGEVMKTQAGEKTVDVSEFSILSKSLLPLPSSWYG